MTDLKRQTSNDRRSAASKKKRERKVQSATPPELPPVSPEKPQQKDPTVDRAEWHARRKRRQKTTPDWKTIWKRFWLGLRIAVLLALVLLLVGGFLFYRQVSDIADAIVVPHVRPNPSLATPLLGGANMLIVGVDERPDHPEEGVRSDTLILSRISGSGQWVNLLSIPRDTQVELLDIGTTKINVAYGQGYAHSTDLYGSGASPQQGGMALAAETVESFLNQSGRSVRVDYTVQVNFEGFVQVIDALGGVTIDVPTHIIDDAYPTENYGIMRIEFQPGPQRMDGETALIYARTRHADSDFGRSQRQQQVMRAIVAELQNRGWAGRVAALPGLLASIKGTGEASPPVLTTLPIDRLDVLAGLILLAGGLDADSIGQIRISPETVGVTEIGSNLLWDPAGVRHQLDLLYRPPQEHTLEVPAE